MQGMSLRPKLLNDFEGVWNEIKLGLEYLFEFQQNSMDQFSGMELYT